MIHEHETPDEHPQTRANDGVVVGLGGSTGGLEALQEFFAHCPSDSGMSFVVVQHMGAHHPSLLAELLAKHTAMRVVEANSDRAPEPDTVYVITPGALLTMADGVLRCGTAEAPLARAPIDTFLRSLAADRGERAVGIVLSGAGYDGTVGLRAIKERGGLTLAQCPESAKHDSMPQSAIGAGVVDHVLSPAHMPAKLIGCARFLAATSLDGATAAGQLESNLGKICSIVHERTGHDFGRYKEGTLLRRIRRRMQIQHLDSVDEYLALLDQPGEPEALLKELLIGVTQFFRDPDAFQALAEQVLPCIVQTKPPELPIRIWVSGCASGEEVYSIAILLREYLERSGARRSVQIFATDLDAGLLAEARLGRYPAAIAEQVSRERLAHFFVREGDSYQAVKELREMCIFSEHSLIRDPPFSQIDLISCRNVLIYLNAELQKRLVSIFHHALRPGGFLFLGPSESIAGTPALFAVLDKRQRIFRRRETAQRPVVDFPLAGRSSTRTATTTPGGRSLLSPQEKMAATFERIVREEYTYPSAVMNGHGDALLVAGPIHRYAQLPAGPAGQLNLFEAFRGGLRQELRAAVRAAQIDARRVVRRNVRYETDEAIQRLRLVVRPLAPVEPEAGLFLVVVQEEAVSIPPTEGEADPGDALDPPALEQLEDELRTTRAELRATVEDLESANEELKSSNEELISTNEELQSANEEMQTSREELQSLNEELETVNTELRQKVDELATANSDLQNLFAATEIATIFLDRSLHVAKFTPAATALFRLIDADVGRPLSDFAPRFTGHDLVADAREVLRGLLPIEHQVQSAEGVWFVVRVLPYRTIDNVIAGVVITFVDVSRIRRAEEMARQQAGLVHLSHDAIFVRRFDGTIESWNHGCEELYGFAHEEAIGRCAHELLGSVFSQPLAEIEAQLRSTGSWVGEIEHRNKDGRAVTVLSNMQLARGEDGIERILEANRDITDRKRTEEALRQGEATLRGILNAASESIWLFSTDGVTLMGNRTAVERMGTSEEMVVGKTIQALLPAELAQSRLARLAEVARTRKPIEFEDTRAGIRFAHSFYPVPGRDGQVDRVAVFSRDVTERRRAAEVLRRYELLASHGRDIVLFVQGEDRRIVEANAAALHAYGYQREEMLALGIADLRAPESKPLTEAQLLAAEEGGIVFESVHRRKDGTPFPVEVSTRAAKLEGVRTLLSVVRDITERKRAEQALRESEQRLRFHLENSPLAVVEWNASYIVTRWSKEAERWFGYAAAETIGRNIADLNLVHPDDLPVVARTMERLSSGQETTVVSTNRNLTKAGAVRECTWHNSVLLDAHGAMASVLSIVEDITERKRAEEALRCANERLREVDQRKNEFLAVLSHELRNPLTPIRNSLYVLAQVAPGSERARHAQEVIDRQTGQLVRLVDDLLDVTRISRNKIHLRKAPLDLNDLVRRTVDDYRSLFVGKELRLDASLVAERLLVDGDDARLAQVLGNLLQNAAKFTPAGGRVEVRTALDRSRQRATLEVLDNGLGIAPTMLGRLFQPFMQAEMTLDRSTGGLGLGLALVKGLVEMHGGEVGVHSDGPGKGARFVVDLPLLADAIAEVAPVPAASPQQGRTILLIEDNVDAANTLREVLELVGHMVDVAYNGPDGVAKARDLKPDVILCDIGLPGMDGFEVARAIRANHSLMDTVLIALSGYALPEDLQRAAEAGFQRHLAKPPSLESLEALFAELPSLAPHVSQA